MFSSDIIKNWKVSLQRTAVITNDSYIWIEEWQAVMTWNRVSEYLELDHIITPDDSDLIKSMLHISKPLVRENSSRYGGFSDLTEFLTRPRYGSESQFECRHCGKKYRWKSTMRRHEQFECGGKEPNFRCPYCPYRAKQKGNLGVHIRKHHATLEIWCVYLSEIL